MRFCVCMCTCVCVCVCACVCVCVQEKYVKEIGERKVNLLLVSKADLLSWKQRWVCITHRSDWVTSEFKGQVVMGTVLQ